jgi:hypothetical protein
MANLVSEYCDLVERGAVFRNAWLVQLREWMTENDLKQAYSQLKRDRRPSQAASLRAWYRRKLEEANHGSASGS